MRRLLAALFAAATLGSGIAAAIPAAASAVTAASHSMVGDGPSMYYD